MRPAVLIVDPDADRRRALSEGLAELGYESIPAAGAEEGRRFVAGLGASVVVAPLGIEGFGDTGLLSAGEAGGALGRTLLLYGDRPEESLDLPEDVLFLPLAGLSRDELVRRVRLVLVGREIGVEPDAELGSLVGELAFMPVLELVRALHRAEASGRVTLPGGEMVLHRGAVVAAGAGAVRGVKAFCRLARRREGPFHFLLERTAQLAVSPEIEAAVPDLVLRALEETHLELPDARSQVRVAAGDLQPDSEQERRLLEVVGRCRTFGQLLDALPTTDGRVLQAVDKLLERGIVRLERPRAPVSVVTDSTSDLPPDMARDHDILVVPLSIVFGKEVLRDGVEINARDFYQLLETSSDHPSTRPPDEKEFLGTYQALIEEQDIISVHISEKLSQTVVHARQAAIKGVRAFGHLPPERRNFALEVVDSQNVSMGVGMQALFAARMAARGQRVFAIAQRLRQMAPRFHTLFVVNTLDYLVRGGRVGKAQALVGKLLGVKPILGVVHGEVAPVDRVRGGRNAHPRIVKLVGERVDRSRPIVATVAHARAPVWADRLKTLLERSFQVREMIVTDIGPVVGTHGGPGTVGCVVFQPEDDEWPLIAPAGGDQPSISPSSIA